MENLTNSVYQLPDGYVDVLLPKHAATNTKKERPAQCRFYDVPIPQNVTTLKEYYSIAVNSTVQFNESTCQNYVYDKSRYSSTVATKVILSILI